ncbi:MAG: putative DNA binding domain-containing protein [Bacilli bacterium]|jgi:predicted HTH transcriptional regulator|nr:putative DNA binding domain-containing protein [Bacilli bacterium]
MNIGKESEFIENKESLGQLDKGLKSLTAMLNRHNSGVVYYGTKDNGDVIGITVGKNTLQDIRLRIREIIQPRIVSEIEVLYDENKKAFIKVSANGSDKPYSCDGRYFIRVIDSDEQMSNDILRKMLLDGDLDLIKQVESDNQDLSFSQCCSFLAARNLHVKDNEGFKRSYGLLTKNNRLNILAFILSDQFNIPIKVVRFNGTDKSAMSSWTDFGDQCLLLSNYQVFQNIKSLDSSRVELVQGIRKETDLFDLEAFREAWNNACVHNRWVSMLPPSVFVFDDRIEVVSYGAIPYGLTKEGFFEGTSMPTNRALFSLFLAAKLTEQSGHGVPIIKSKYGKEAFSFDNGMIKVTIPFSYVPDFVDRRKNEESAVSSLTTKQLLVYKYLISNPQSTLGEVALKTALSLAGVKKIVLMLQKKNLIKRLGSKKNGEWIKSTL